MIRPELGYITGRAGHVFLTVYGADGSTVARARSASGIVEDVGAHGIYVLSAGGIDLEAGIVVWDDDGTFLGGEMLTEPVIATVAPLVLPGGGVTSAVVNNTKVWKRGDTDPIIYPITLADIAGNPVVVDVTGCEGKFKMRAHADLGTLLINEDFYICDTRGVQTADGQAGLVAYKPDNGGARTDTMVDGSFLGEFELIFPADSIYPAGTKKTFPTTADTSEKKAYIQIEIEKDLDDEGSS